MKTVLLFLCLLTTAAGKAQQVDSIYVNLYTDSLKKNTYNYINVDGLLRNGKYMPLDTTHLNFCSDYGKFYGNSLWIANELYSQPVHITITLKKDPAVQKHVVLYVKRQEDGMLKTADELLNEMRSRKKGKRS